MRLAIAIGVLVGLLGCGNGCGSVDPTPDANGGGSGGDSAGATGTGGSLGGSGGDVGRGGTTGTAGTTGGSGAAGAGGSTPTCPENAACNGFHDTSFGVMQFNGICHAGDCCMGCWANGACHYEGETLCAVGMHGGGAACVTCPSGTGTCKITNMGNYLCMP